MGIKKLLYLYICYRIWNNLPFLGILFSYVYEYNY